MKRLVSILPLFILCITYCGAQDNPMHRVFRIARFQATVAGKVCDTISREELLNAGTVDIDGYDNYKIVSFVCSVTSIPPWAKNANDKTVTELKSSSGIFTRGMYKSFESLYGVAKILFTDILCKGPDRKLVKMNDVRLALQNPTDYSIDTTVQARSRSWWGGRQNGAKRTYPFKIGVAEQTGGSIRKKQLLDAGRMEFYTKLGKKMYIYTAPKIISFKVCVHTKKGFRSRYADDQNFNSSIDFIIANAKPGSKVIFKKIVVLMPDGEIKTFKRVTFKLKRHWFFNRDL